MKVMNKKQIKIGLKDYDYVCGDGCCSEYGCHIYINDKKIDTVIFSSSSDIAMALEFVLKHLGYEVEIEYLHEY